MRLRLPRHPVRPPHCHLGGRSGAHSPHVGAQLSGAADAPRAPRAARGPTRPQPAAALQERHRTSRLRSSSACDSWSRRDSMRRLARVLIVACALIPMIGSLPAVGAQTPVTGLVWSPCPAPFATSATPVVDPAEFPPGLECVTLSVPLDYSQPQGEQISIGLNRLPALDSEQRIGNLVFNPGGPGSAATDIIAFEALGASLFTPAVRAHFDVVGMDPRGVGTSTPVRCDPAIWNQVVSWFPSDEPSFAQLREHYRAFGDSCLRLTGPLLAQLDT